MHVEFEIYTLNMKNSLFVLQKFTSSTLLYLKTDQISSFLYPKLKFV